MQIKRIYLFLFLSIYTLDIWASPSSLFWTNCTTEIIETGIGKINCDNYFTVFNRRGHGSTLPTVVGFDIGAFTWKKISCEAGIDYLCAQDHPLYFNAKIGVTDEGVFFPSSPSFNVGIFNVGTHSKPVRTNQNIVDLIFGKNLPDWIGGTFYAAGFAGSKAIGKNRYGFMIGYARNFCPATYCDGTEYNKWVFSADYASGKNTIGGGGFALTYCFTPHIDFQTGPVWFNSTQINGSWKWSIQIDFQFEVFSSRCLRK